LKVYSPHTALDSAEGGINDWLADIITGLPATVPESIEKAKKDGELPATPDVENSFSVPKRPIYLLSHHPSHAFRRGKDLRLYVGSSENTANIADIDDIIDLP
jgi:NIF3 (NGG1p interacting factor 3)